jgi:hypothetical protein
MKFKTVISISLIAILFLSSVSLANESNDTLMRTIKIPEVPKVTAVVPKAPKVTAVVPQAVKIKTIQPQIRANKKNRAIRENQKIDFHREFKHKRNQNIIFSKRTPPNYSKMTLQEKDVQVGDVKNSRLSLYLRAPYIKPKDVEKKLKDAGFEILSAKPVDKKKKLISIIFTNDALKSMADKPNRGFAASLRVLVDSINKQISITNPMYISRAFMQDDFDKAVAESVLVTIRKTFTDLKDSEDIVKFNLLPKYVFMSGMPAYHDMVTLGKGTYEKHLKKAKKSKKVLFVQELSKNRAVVGVKLSKRTAKFIKKAGYANAALLPYPVLLEGSEAKIMDPKYYISVMYPLLKMGTFMKISTVPGAINNEIKKIFK